MTDWDSEYYKGNAHAQEKRASKLLEDLHFHGDEIVLDIGCGDGKITKEIADRLPSGQVIGIDPSPNMIAQARRDFSQIPNLRFEQKRAEVFSFDQKFDLITSFNALHWVKDQAAVLRNAKASLKKGGEIFFLMTSGEKISKFEGVFDKAPWKSHVQKEGEGRFYRIFEENYLELLEHFRFEKKRVEQIEFSHQFEDRKGLENHFMTWIPFAFDLSHEKCLELAGDMVANVVTDGPGTENVTFSHSMLLVRAKCSA